jgi:glutamine synthetase
MRLALYATSGKATMRSHEFDLSEIQTFIVASVDMQGRLFGRRLVPDAFAHAEKHGISVSSCALGWDIEQTTGLQVDYTGDHTGWHDLQLFAETNTLRRLTWMQSTALCLADVCSPISGKPVGVAPRMILKRQIESLDQLGLDAMIGIENEFFLFKGSYAEARTGDFKNLRPSTFRRGQDLITPDTNTCEPFLSLLRRNAYDSGIQISSCQAEWGVGQWEVGLLHQDPLRAADELTLLKLAVKDIAQTCGFSATFMARPFETDVGSSSHINISITDKSHRNIFFDDSQPNSIAHSMLHAIGGILHNASSCMTFYAPTVNSYKRTVSRLFAGNGNTWGFDNRSVSCRVVGNNHDSLRIEFRTPGADANPYLACAAVLASVKDGIEEKRDPGPPVVGDSYSQKKQGDFPEDLRSAAQSLRTSRFAASAFGTDIIRHYSALAEYEWLQFKQAVTDWERNRYFVDA